jgi:hypothetical protein
MGLVVQSFSWFSEEQGLMGRENRRVVRITLKHPLKVMMGSIGSDVRYELGTRDVSNQGFFLDFEKPNRFPFTPASIMEIWMELEASNTIFFNGKMARIVYPTDQAAKVSGPGIAVRIVQIDPEEEKRLVRFIETSLASQEGTPQEEPAA